MSNDKQPRVTSDITIGPRHIWCDA